MYVVAITVAMGKFLVKLVPWCFEGIELIYSMPLDTGVSYAFR